MAAAQGGCEDGRSGRYARLTNSPSGSVQPMSAIIARLADISYLVKHGARKFAADYEVRGFGT